MIVAVEPAGYLDAATSLRDANRATADLHGRLVSDLAATAGMAGDDASATEFAAAYDDAAAEALAGIADLAAACATLGRLTERSGANHADAERRSILPGRVIPQPCAPMPESGYIGVLPATPPTSLGGDPPFLTPHEAWILDHIEAFVWPDADIERLRTAADAWRAAAGSLDQLTAHVDRATAAWDAQRSPEAGLAVAALSDVRGSMGGLAEACAALGGHCDSYAGTVEQKRAEVLALIREILVMVVEGMVIGAVIGALTAGAGAGVTAAAVVARVFAQSPRFAAILAALRSATAGITASVRATQTLLRTRRARLERFLRVPTRTAQRAMGPIIAGRRIPDAAGLRRTLVANTRPGHNKPHRVVGSQDTLEGLFRTLTRGADEITVRDYAGLAFRLPDGTLIAMRSESASGGATIDIQRVGSRLMKVHIGE